MSVTEQTIEQASPGRTLAAARAGLKLSLADVSQQIKYGVKQIAAIEADDYAKLPGTTFVRGMIRSYAKLVQIDPEPLLADLGRRDTPGVAVAAVDLRISGKEPFVEGGAKSNRVYVLLSVAALLAVAVVAYEWWSNPLDTGEVVTIVPRAEQGDANAAAPTPAPAPAPAPAVAPPVQEPPAAAAASVPEPAGEGGARTADERTLTAPAAAAGAGGPGRIELEFNDLSWVEVKQADGKILLSHLNPAGTRQVIEGVPPFAVVIGNAASVRLKYNDAPVDLRPYFKVDVARLKLE